MDQERNQLRYVCELSVGKMGGSKARYVERQATGGCRSSTNERTFPRSPSQGTARGQGAAHQVLCGLICPELPPTTKIHMVDKNYFQNKWLFEWVNSSFIMRTCLLQLRSHVTDLLHQTDLPPAGCRWGKGSHHLFICAGCCSGVRTNSTFPSLTTSQNILLSVSVLLNPH